MTLIFNRKEMKGRRRALRSRRLGGCRFENQYSIGNHVVDFYSPQMKLVIEVDGRNHDSADGADIMG